VGYLLFQNYATMGRHMRTYFNEQPVLFMITTFFPNLCPFIQVNDNVNLSASYSKKIQQADYNTLDPNNFANFDQYNSSNGNPLLQPTFYDNFELKLNAYQFVTVGANYTIAKDKNLFIFEAEPGELVSNSTFQQFDKFKTLSFYASFPIPLDYFFKGKADNRKNLIF